MQGGAGHCSGEGQDGTGGGRQSPARGQSGGHRGPHRNQGSLRPSQGLGGRGLLWGEHTGAAGMGAGEQLLWVGEGQEEEGQLGTRTPVWGSWAKTSPALLGLMHPGTREGDHREPGTPEPASTKPSAWVYSNLSTNTDGTLAHIATLVLLTGTLANAVGTARTFSWTWSRQAPSPRGRRLLESRAARSRHSAGSAGQGLTGSTWPRRAGAS